MSAQLLTPKKVNNIMYNVGTVIPKINGNEQGSNIKQCTVKDPSCC